MPTFKEGDRIRLATGNISITVKSYISQGGQGEVYRVSYLGQDYALKWYSKYIPPKEFYKNLMNNVKNGAAGEHFLWPRAVTSEYNGTFGYVMRLIPDEYKEYSDFLLGNVRFSSWSMMIKAAFNIVESFFLLHSKGYSYQDLNEGGFFINPGNGDVLICDNDNVAPFGVNLGVKGMPKYMAPEVVTNLSLPSTHTDRFSLAVILFRLFYIDHPLEGKYTIQFPLTDQIGAKLFGENPVFIYDPENDINRPDETAHPNVIKRWNMFPPDLNITFIRAFTSGMKDINGRITEAQWIETLVKVRSMLIKDDNGNEQFVNAYKPSELPPYCRVLKTENTAAALSDGSYIYLCQSDQMSADYNTVTGVVKSSKDNKNILGLANVTEQNWTVTLPNRNPIVVKPKTYAPLIPGTIINFGNTTATIY